MVRELGDSFSKAPRENALVAVVKEQSTLFPPPHVNWFTRSIGRL